MADKPASKGFRVVKSTTIKSVGRRGKSPEVIPTLVEGLSMITDEQGVVFDEGTFAQTTNDKEQSTTRSKITSQWLRMVRAGEVPNRKLNVYFVNGWAEVRLNPNGSPALDAKELASA